MDSAAPAVVHNTARARFELETGGGGPTAHLDYQMAGDRIRFVHIEVPPAQRGQHHAEELTQAGLEYARQARLRVVPICPFVREYLARTPEYLPLVDDHWQGLVR